MAQLTTGIRSAVLRIENIVTNRTTICPVFRYLDDTSFSNVINVAICEI
jgi:hypothetical protein